MSCLKLGLQLKVSKSLLNNIHHRILHSSCCQLQHKSEKQLPKADNSNFKQFYRCPSIIPIRALSKMKLYQTAFLVIATPILYVSSPLALDYIPLEEANAFALAGSFATATLFYFAYVTRRLVGSMWLNEVDDTVKVAYLTFWAQRKDVILPLESIKLMDNPEQNYVKPLVKLNLNDTDEFYFLSLRYGQITESRAFKKVFGKVALDQLKVLGKK